MESNYKVECPKYLIECDIESCPRYLVQSVVDIDEETSELTASGFCHERGIKYFSGIESGKITEKTITERHKELRTKGYCEFNGYEVHRSIFIEPGEYIKINSHKFSFTAGKSWEIYTRFFRSIKAGEDNTEKHFPVPLTTNDVNQLKDDAYALFDKYIERQPAAKKVRNKQYESFARFKIELL